MKTKISNATIIKNFDTEPFCGDIIVQDDKIAYVGKSTSQTADVVIDARQNIVMPGFVNANCKCASILFGNISGKKWQEFDCHMSALEKSLLPNDVYWGTMLAGVQLVKSGVTCVGENYHFAEASKRAFCDLGLRAVVAVKQRYSPKKFLSQQEAEQTYQSILQSDGLVTANFACKDVLCDSEQTFATAMRLAIKNSTFVATNANQTLEEVGKCATQNDDLSPIELLEQYGFFDHKALVLHATNVEPRDLKIIAKNGASICANFSSDYALANGIAPIYQMQNYGINVCLGTDSYAQGGKFDMFREMYLALQSQKVLLSDGGLLTAKDVLKMATTNGAKALGINSGELAQDKNADLVVIDVSNLDPSHIFDSIVMTASMQDVMMTMSNGKILWDSKKCHFEKTEKTIFKNAKKSMQKFK